MKKTTTEANGGGGRCGHADVRARRHAAAEFAQQCGSNVQATQRRCLACLPASSGLGLALCPLEGAAGLGRGRPDCGSQTERARVPHSAQTERSVRAHERREGEQALQTCAGAWTSCPLALQSPAPSRTDPAQLHRTTHRGCARDRSRGRCAALRGTCCEVTHCGPSGAWAKGLSWPRAVTGEAHANNPSERAALV